MKDKSDIGLIGLAVMGENLSLNFAGKGFTVSAWDREATVRSRFLEGRAIGLPIRCPDTLQELADSLETPRKVMMMVRAGEVVDLVIEQLLPVLESGDIIIDGGNSLYTDTNRRVKELADKGIHFIGAGVSGGEEGALNGPAIMPGGAREAWPTVAPLLQAIAAQVDGQPCCEWTGDAGAGHFVKMVHNGIEYGDMQLICECYQLMHELLGMTHEEMSAVFHQWNAGPLASYLVEITADILVYREDGEPLVEKVLDTAGQKGTGKWTAVTALDLGVPLTLINEAVFARCLSSQKEQRIAASEKLAIQITPFTGDTDTTIRALGQSLLASKIVSYAQGFALMREAASEFGWTLDYAAIARLWRGGCIIRSAFLNDISHAFTEQPDLDNLMLDDVFADILLQSQAGWRQLVATAIAHGLPCPALASAINYFDGYRSARLPANLLQAQRDYFGAHTYERTDRPRGEHFHTNWTGHGGNTASGTYKA